MIWIILGCFILLLLIINETEFLLRFKTDYRKLQKVSYCDDITMKHEVKKESVILMLHEFSGTPKSFEMLGKRLYSEGYDIEIPALPGSVENYGDFQQSVHPNFKLWRNFVLDRYLELAWSYKNVYIAGASLGGSLALFLAEFLVETDNKPAGIITLSAPVSMKGKHFRKRISRNFMLSFSGIFSLLVRQIKTGVLSDEAKELCPVYGFEGILVPASAHSQKLGLRNVKKNLRKINTPLLAFHAEGDATVSEKNLDVILSSVSSENKEGRLFDLKADHLTRHHRIVNHGWLEDEIFEKTKYFINNIEGHKGK